MGKTSVTGLGSGSECLTGPRWTYEKEKEFKEMKKLLNRLYVFNCVSNVLIVLFIFLFLFVTVFK